MKRTFLALSVVLLCLLLTTTAFSQVKWPDPCIYDYGALVGPGKPFNWNDGVYRVPVSIANMGYWDENGGWYWWTETPQQLNTIPPCFPKGFDDRAANLFYDPNTKWGTAVLPMCKKGNCSQYKRYDYMWPVYSGPNLPLPERETFTPWQGYTVSNFEFRYKHYEDGSSKLNVVFRAGFNVMVPQFWWEPNIANLDDQSGNDIPWENNAAWGILANWANAAQYIPVFYADPTLSHQLTLNDIEYAEIEEEGSGGWDPKVSQGAILTDTDSRYQFMSMNYDGTRSWWSPYDLAANVTDNTETSMKIEGWLPTALKKYRLVIKIKNGPEIVSNTYTCPNYFDLGFIKSENRKGKNLISLTEEDGKLIIEYPGPELYSLYDSGVPQAPPPFPPPNITGSHVRIGLFVVNTPQINKGAWIRVPAHLGTVVVPKDVVDWLKSQPEYNGTIDVVIHQRDNYIINGFNRYYTDTVTYTFAP